MVGVEPVDEAPIELYTKLRKTRAIEMDVMQKLHIGKLSNLTYIISTYHCLYQYHCTSSTYFPIDLTILLYSDMVC